MRPPKKLTAAAVDQIRASTNYHAAALEAGIDEDRAKRIKKADTLEEALMIGGVDHAAPPVVPEEQVEADPDPDTTTPTATEENPPSLEEPPEPEDKVLSVKKAKKADKPKTSSTALRASSASEANVLAIIPKSFTVNSLLLQVAKKVTEEEWHWPAMDMGDWIDTYLFWTMKQRGVVIGSYQMVPRNGNHSEEGRDAS